MKVNVIVKANAKENKLELIGNNSFKVFVKAPAQEGKANQAVIKLLAAHFDATQKEVVLKAGQRAKNKVFSVGG
jgi:uncharacterized protein